MDFKSVSLEQAENTILAHSLNLKQGKIKKGTVLSKENISALKEKGYRSILVAIPAIDDVAEDIAAAKLAEAIAGDLVSIDKAVTGRTNLRAKQDGILCIDETLLNRINSVDECLTVATLRSFERVYQGQLIATIKVIPYAVADSILQSCLSIVRDSKESIYVSAFKAKTVGFIQTEVEGLKTEVLNKSSRVLAQRLQLSGSELVEESRCSHELDAVANAIQEFRQKDIAILIISGATAVSDRNDVVPSAIVKCGGEIVHFGMPVDPGNLLLLAKCDGKYVIAMPGCARSPKFNGFDIVLERLLADIPVTAMDIMRMGTGGLLKDIPERPQARSMRFKQGKSKNHKKITAIVLAAGLSRRMGKENKLLIKIDNHPMVEHVVKMLSESVVADIKVVLGFEADKIKNALSGYKVTFVHNPDFEQGLSSSLIAGLQNCNEASEAVLVCLADMPMLSKNTVQALIDAFDPDAGREICLPVYRGKRGNPVLWSSRFIPKMKRLQGDVGAKHLLYQYDDNVFEVPIQDASILQDFDTPNAVEYHHRDNKTI